YLASALCRLLQYTTSTHPSPLSLPDALPISGRRPPLRRRSASQRRATGFPASCRAGRRARACRSAVRPCRCPRQRDRLAAASWRSEEHTSLQSRENLVCRLLLEKKKLSNFTN